MSEIRWELYPLVATHERSRAWLQLQSYLQLAPTTLDAYGRSLNDFLAFCQRCEIVPETITREQVALYVQDLAQRPNPKGAKVLSIESGRGLSNATMQLRITVLRLFCDSLIERQLRQDNPVGRGHYVPGKAFGGARSRGLLPRYQKLPWIPSDQEFQFLLHSLEGEILRNQVFGEVDFSLHRNAHECALHPPRISSVLHSCHGSVTANESSIAKEQEEHPCLCEGNTCSFLSGNKKDF